MTKLTIKEWLENQEGLIDQALAEWCVDTFDYDRENFTVKNVIEQLQRIDCAGCSAPAGLIYNYESASHGLASRKQYSR